jgi:hypothetical protein
MSIQISGCTVIDNNRNITNANNMCVGVVTMTGSSGDIETPGNISAGGLDIPPVPISLSPTDGETDVAPDTNINITFSQIIVKGTGNITLRNGSAVGTVIETIAVTSDRVTISGAVVTIDTVNRLPNFTNVYVVVDAGAFTGININTDNELLDTYNFTTVDFEFSSFTPTNGATNVGINTNITLAFTNPPIRGSGTITLRRDSTTGTVLESFDAATSDRISISGNNWILDPTSDLPYTKTIHLVIPSTAIINYVGLNISGTDTYSFTTGDPALGASYEGGFLICKSSPIRWIVAPSSSQVSRTWYAREDANTRAQQVSGCSGWFVPTCGQLQNPGYTCRTFWDSFSPTCYWSSTVGNNSTAWWVCFTTGLAGGGFQYLSRTITNCVRSFRCVTY